MLRFVRSRLVRIACALLVGACIATSGSAHADTDDARGHFTRAVELFKEGDFRAALIEFQRAYDAAPNYKVLYNLGQTNLELQDYAGALKAFRGYLDGGGRDIAAARRTQVEAELKRLESRVARVEIAVNVEGADITIDDVSVGRSPLSAPVLVGAGRRKIAGTKAGLSSASRVIDVAGGDKPKVSLELVEQQSAPQIVVQTSGSDGATVLTPQPTNTPLVAVHTSSGPSTWFYVGLATTGALAAATGILGGLALGAKSTFDSRVAQLGVTSSSVESARDDVKNFALATDITLGVTVAAAITTVILAFTTSNKHTTREGTKASFYVSPFGFGVSGSM
jgi:hypothetical protein